MSQNIRAVDGTSPRHGRIWNVAGSGQHVGLVDTGESLDRRAVEADALVEGPLELGRRDGYGLEEPEHVGEPQPHEADVALLQRPEHEVFLLAHGASVARPPPRFVCGLPWDLLRRVADESGQPLQRMTSWPPSTPPYTG
jgi:hypothetical protein